MSDAVRGGLATGRSVFSRLRPLGPGRLFRKYALPIVGLVALVLLLNGGLDLWFGFRDSAAALDRLQQEKADAAARRIGAFIEEIKRQIGWTTHAQWAAEPVEQRRFDYFRLLRQAPAITELTQLDPAGNEVLRVSRLSMDAVGSGKDRSQTAAFVEALKHKVWFGPVHFRKESEPYMTLAMAASGRSPGVTVAEVNLKLIQDVIDALRVGHAGYAFVVDERGRLIAHPDASLVLRDTELSGLPQVAAALAGTPDAPAAPAARTIDGRAVLSAHATVAPLGWIVFVETPLADALAPLYASIWRSAGLLLLALVLAGLAALLLARRMTGPIRQLQEGAARIGAGELDRRIAIETGDEIEDLAQGFNRMAGALQESYAGLERKVADRTAELEEALDQQTATAEVLQVINSSPGNLAPVFDAILEKAHNLCAVSHGGLALYDAGTFRPMAMRGYPQGLVDRLRRGYSPHPDHPMWQLLKGESYVHVSDLAAVDDPTARAVAELGIRTTLFLALRRAETFLGMITAARDRVQPFAEKEIALLQNFAAQAVVAIENARLLIETREALAQQTATAEVLGVINASPGNLTPVFEAMLEKASRLCEAQTGHLLRYENGTFSRAASLGIPEEFDRLLPLDTPMPDALTKDSVVARLLASRALVHVHDLREDEAYRIGAPAEVAAVEQGGIRTALFVPLLREGEVVGAFLMHRLQVRPFSDKQIALLQNFAAQAVIAMENARLITETREALEQQTATAEVLQVINSSPGDLAPVFDAMLEKAVRLCEFDFSSLWTYDGSTFHPAARHQVPDPLWTYLQDHTPPAFARVVGGENLVHIADVKQTAWMQTDFGRDLQRFGLDTVRSLLIVPLRKDDALLGVIVAYRRDVRPFSQKQIALLQNFAAQAVIAMENARLIADTREALEQQTATAEVLQVINSSPGDLAPVFETMLEKAMRLCTAAFGYLLAFDGERFQPVAHRGLPAPFADYLLRMDQPGQSGAYARIRSGAPLVHVADLKEGEVYQTSPLRRALVDLGGARTGVVVALCKDEALLGVFTIYRQEVRPFADKEIALLQNFAAQAVIAIENARLLGELRERTAELGRSVDELRMLSEVAQAVSSTLDLRAVLSTILTRSVGLTGADAGAVFRYSRAERSYRLVEAVGWDEALTGSVGELHVPESETALGEAAAMRAPLQIADLADRPGAPLRDLNLGAGFRGVLIVPLVGPERVLGALVLQRRAAGEFPPETVRLMQTLAGQSVLAIQNARLYREIAEKSEELALASRHKSQFLANMSHELRTPLNAILGYAELLVDGIYGALPEKAQGVLERVQNNGKHLLALINDVLDLAKIEAGQLTLTLEDYNLPELVRTVVIATEPLAAAKGLKFTTALQEGLPMAHGDARRVSQVLLNLVGNAIKFTDTGEIEIRAGAEKGQFAIEVRDTGPGIADADQDRIFGEFQQIDDTNTRKKGGTGLGLAISKRMVEMQGGLISIESELGKGSTFRVVLPVRVEPALEEAAE